MAETTYVGRKENKVFARGRILGFNYEDAENLRLTLYIRGSKGKEAAYIPFVIPNSMQEGLNIGDTIEVEGHYLVQKVESTSPDGKEKTIRQFVADKITHALTELEKHFGEKGFAYDHAYCKAFFKGKVTDVRRSLNEWVNVRLQIPGEYEGGEENSVLLQYTTNMRVNDIKVRKGDTVCAVCFATSKRKTRDGRVISYEDLILEDMAVTEKAC